MAIFLVRDYSNQKRVISCALRSASVLFTTCWMFSFKQRFPKLRYTDPKKRNGEVHNKRFINFVHATLDRKIELPNKKIPRSSQSQLRK